MSSKPQTNYHDGTAVNCINHLNVIAFGKKPNPERVCMMTECDPARYVESALKPAKRTRRRATKAAS